MRRLATAAVAVALAVGVAACGDDDGAEGDPIPPSSTSSSAESSTSSSDPSSASTEAQPELPPPTATELEPIYGEALAAIGMQLTDRGGLIDRSGGGYVASPEGRHLALYVEPIDERSLQEYYDGILDVALVFSDIYDRWPGLQTYDVCQEPLDPDGSQGPEPLPVTQIELTREESDAVDWDTVTVEDLVRASRAEPPELALRVSAEMARFPAYAALVASEGFATGGY